MDMGWMIPLGIVGSISASHAFRTWVRAKHGYPLESDHGGKRYGLAHRGGTPEAQRQLELLGSENERLTGQVLRHEERIAVLERIATDRGVMLGEEIEQLRDRAN